jgi:hypothetical protein
MTGALISSLLREEKKFPIGKDFQFSVLFIDIHACSKLHDY